MQANATHDFVSQIARLTMNRECSNCGKAADRPSLGCAEHEPFRMEYDDAVETVHALILRARELTMKNTNAGI
jgi:hypothetical protein